VNRQGRQERVCFADGRSRNWQHFHTMEIVTEDMGNTTQESLTDEHIFATNTSRSPLGIERGTSTISTLSYDTVTGFVPLIAEP